MFILRPTIFHRAPLRLQSYHFCLIEMSLPTEYYLILNDF